MCKYQPKKLTDWIKDVRKQMVEQLPKDYKIMDDGAVYIKRIDFFFKIPKSTPKLVRMSIESKHCLAYKYTRPDLDNLMKNIFDVCNGILWKDDGQIVDIHASKRIDNNGERIEIEFNHPLEHQFTFTKVEE